MQRQKLLQSLISTSLIILFLVGCSVPATPTPMPIPPTAASSSPESGTWIGSAEFGTFEFIVNPDSTGITKINYNFSEWQCGPTKVSGGIGIGQETGWEGWSVSGGRFTIENTLDPGESKQTMTINGTFDQNGTQASGSWEGTSYGENCSGTWKASFSK